MRSGGPGGGSNLVRRRNPRAVHVVRDLQGLPEGRLMGISVSELFPQRQNKDIPHESI